MEKASIERINALTRIARQRELTEAEKLERQTLRSNCLKAIRRQLTDQLDNVVVEYPDRHREPLRKKR